MYLSARTSASQLEYHACISQGTAPSRWRRAGASWIPGAGGTGVLLFDGPC